ncbi:aspartate/glutamate racemase family protein [Streptomyces sp. L7]
MPGPPQAGHHRDRTDPAWGPESAEGWLDSYLSAAAVMDLLRTYDGPSYDAVVMAGFWEHGREGVRELVDVPVVDITEAAAHLSQSAGPPLRRRHHAGTVLRPDRGQPGAGGGGPQLRGRGGDGARCPGPGRTRPARRRHSLTAAERARAAGAEVLVLGCAGMTGLQRAVGEKLGLPVVDGVGAAVKLAESLVGLGLRTSRAGSYGRPVPKRRTWGEAPR